VVDVFRRRREAQSTAVAEPALEPAGDGAPGAENRHDERLVRAAQAGDLPSFNALVTRHERAVFAVCYRVLRDVEAAEDATQDTFVKAWSSLSSFRGGLVRPWLLRIATNRCLDLLRARGRRPADSLDAQTVEVEPRWTSQTASGEHPEAFAARSELSGALERALDRLPEDQRVVTILADIHGHSYEEIAQITGVAVGTVKSRISRSRSRLREILTADPASRELFERFARHYDD
jgi:RNA polymerase sigma-70 factor (ECF subfamily)